MFRWQGLRAGQSLSHAGDMNTKDARNEKGMQIIRRSKVQICC